MKNKTYKILLVDDEKLHREMYSDYLTKHGFDVTCESNAVSALEKLSKERFDLLVTDIMMAGMNGWELIKTIREDMKMSEIKLPIIVVSAFFDSSSKEWETYRYKGNAYLFVKGGSLTELLIQAEKLTGRKKDYGMD